MHAIPCNTVIDERLTNICSQKANASYLIHFNMIVLKACIDNQVNPSCFSPSVHLEILLTI